MAKITVPAESGSDERVEDAIKFLKLANEADTENRQQGLDDLKFSAGNQWPIEVQNSRHLEARPCLTINKIDAYVRQITNQMRQSRPRMRAHSMNSEANAKVADIITGIFKHIEVNSDADTAYDTAGEYAVRVGWGYWRVITDYVREDSFDQEIFIKPIDNPFSVYFDPNSLEPDGSDAEKALITQFMPKDTFRKEYPGRNDGSNFNERGTGDFDPDWVQKDAIRVAEYFYIERKKTKLLMLSDGTKVFKEDAPPMEIMAAAGVEVVAERDTMRKSVKWCKLTGMEVLEERTWPGKFIPIIPVYGQQLTVEDKRKKYGLVRQAKDSQRMYNYWQTAMTESIALAPKAKWLLAEGQDEGHENEWAQANIKSQPVLRYKQTDINGKEAPPPQRLQPEPPPAGVIAAAMSIDKDLQSVVGIFDPSQLPQGNQSGKAIRGQQTQIDMTNFHFFDNLTRSIKHTGRIILDLIPKIYDKERVMRIIGYDGKPELVTINQKVAEDGVDKVLNDVTVGEYDVYMDTGPGYQSKRQEAVEAMMPMISTNQELFNLAGDLVFRNMDFPGAEVIADRLAAVNPLAQIDEKSDVPPAIQMQLQQAEKKLADMQQLVAALQLEKQYRSDIEMIRQEAETKRKLMDVTSRAYNTDTINEAKVNQQILAATASQNKTEIDAITKLLLKRMDTGQLRQVIAEKDAEQAQVADMAAQDVHVTRNPFIQEEMNIAQEPIAAPQTPMMPQAPMEQMPIEPGIMEQLPR